MRTPSQPGDHSRRAFLRGLGAFCLAASGCGSRDIEATDIEQVSVAEIARRVQQARGEIVVLYVYAASDEISRSAQPVFNRVVARYRRKVTFVVVSVDEDAEALAAFLADEGVPFAPLVSPMATGERLAPALAPLGAVYEGSIPYGAVFGRDGALVRQWTGPASVDSLTGTLDPLLR